VRADPKLRALLALACVSGFYIAPEGLVVPYSDQIGAGTWGVGVLLAANPLGTAIGMVLLSRFVAPDRRVRLAGRSGGGGVRGGGLVPRGRCLDHRR
jgi:hypothetical protein